MALHTNYAHNGKLQTKKKTLNSHSWTKYFLFCVCVFWCRKILSQSRFFFTLYTIGTFVVVVCDKLKICGLWWKIRSKHVVVLFIGLLATDMMVKLMNFWNICFLVVCNKHWIILYSIKFVCKLKQIVIYVKYFSIIMTISVRTINIAPLLVEKRDHLHCIVNFGVQHKLISFLGDFPRRTFE